MNKIVRNIFIIIVILVFLLGFSASYSSLTIDNLAYVIALGIDKGENEKFKFTFQFSTASSSSESGGGNEKSPLILNSIEANSINSAINLMNAYMAKQLNMSHCRLIIFSEEVAINGISNEIYTLINNAEVRSSANVIVTKTNAYDYISNSSPILENLITNYYEIFPNSGKYTGYVYNVTLGNFFNQLICDTCEPFAILGGTNNSSSNSSDTSKSLNIADVKSSNTPISAKRSSENIGIAVFKEDKMVGELSALETLCLSIIRGEVDSFLITIQNPQNEQETIDLMIYNENKKKIKIDIVNNSPYITVDFKFNGRISSMKEDLKYLDSSTLDNISEKANQYLESILTNYLYKTSLELKSDINGFGKYGLSKFLTIQEFELFDWKNSYTNSTFNVSVNTEIESGTLITET